MHIPARVVLALLLSWSTADADSVVRRPLQRYEFVALSVPIGLGLRVSFPELRSAQGIPERLTAALTNARLFAVGRPDPDRNTLIVTALRQPGGHADLFLGLGGHQVTLQLTAVATRAHSVSDLIFDAPATRPAPLAVRTSCHRLHAVAQYALRTPRAQRILLRVKRDRGGHRLVLRIPRLEMRGSWVSVPFRLRSRDAGLRLESVTLLALTRAGRLIHPLATGWAGKRHAHDLRGVAVARIAGAPPRALGLAIVTNQGQVQARW
ncbi:MAG TPA: hypothetical protein VFN52_06650 [Acidiferrobacteraceae bacterium]|nr:hypothetical protein [Acidiferrobacteraceae bacterium]